MKKNLLVISTGVIIGIAALALTALGNPANMGFCIACFLRDTAGAMRMHSAAAVQYVRPEITGIIIGAMCAALIGREWRAVGGSAPMLRFIIGMMVSVGALVFLGCPIRMAIRIGGGDFNALVGLAGFAAGIFAGTVALKKGFSLKRNYSQTPLEGLSMPGLSVMVLGLAAAVPSLFIFSQEGPGSKHAPVLIALAAGLLVGAIAQRSRFCMMGGIRDGIMFNQWGLAAGLGVVIITVLAGNLMLDKFSPGFADQPIAHSDGLMNFLGMGIVGWGSVLLGGCPMRQLVLAGEGNADSGVTVLGFLAGAAMAHNFGTASSGAGAGPNGPAAVAVCYGLLLAVTLINIKNGKKA